MKWDNDPIKELKWELFEMLRLRLPEDCASKVTVKQLANAIDEMIDKLTKSDEE